MCPRLMFQAAKHNVYIEPNTQRVYLRHALFYTFSESRKRRYFLFYSILFVLFKNMF